MGGSFAKLAAAFAAVLLLAGPALAQDDEAKERILIGFLDLIEDPRRTGETVYARIQLRARGTPFPAAEVAIEESAVVADFLKLEFAIERLSLDGADDIVAAIGDWIENKGVRYFLLDLPGDMVAEVARRTRGAGALLFNLTAPENELRGPACQAHLMHTSASYAMQMDALMQYLLSKQWRDLLILGGPRPADKLIVESMERAAKRFGGKIIDIRPFVLSNDPRQRGQNNIALMTAGRNYDVVFVADSDGEFGRYVPFQTVRPRPVVGTTGLVPEAWTWSWERHGAPQLNSRFERKAGRRMTGQDWSAWVAVKAIVTARTRARSSEFEKIVAFMKGDRLRLDGFKGPAINFRPWNNQLRQPILLASHNAVIERAPIDGFLHASNNLDTLGDDEPDSECRF